MGRQLDTVVYFVLKNFIIPQRDHAAFVRIAVQIKLEIKINLNQINLIILGYFGNAEVLFRSAKNVVMMNTKKF